MNKRRSTMRQCMRQKNICRATESLCSVTKDFSHTIKLVFLEYCTQPIFCSIDAITDKYMASEVTRYRAT